MFGNTTIGILLFVTHLLASITVGYLFRFWGNNDIKESSRNKTYYSSNKTTVKLSNLGEILADSINSAISTVLMIGGFIVIFACIISILKTCGALNFLGNLISPFFYFMHIDTVFATPILTGILEITSGISSISNIAIKEISLNIILSAFLLGTGGISILLQVWSIVSKTDLSIKPYIIGKLAHGIIAAIYTFVFINIFPFFNFNI